MRFIRPILGATLLALLCAAAAIPAEPPKSSGDQAGLQKAFDAYISAFNAGDARALADQWAEDAEYSAPDGAKYKGRAKIRDAFEVFFREHKGGKITVSDTETVFDSPEQARTRGTAVFTRPGETPSETKFTAIHVKKDGAWKMASVGEAPTSSPGYAHLKDLEWLIGEWVGGDRDTRAESSFEWTANKNFISVSFKVVENGEPDLEGMEVIGWDPERKAIRSWFFDSTGRFGEGIWTNEGDRWAVKTTATLGRGNKASAVNIFTPVDRDSFKWSSSGREVGGEPLPSTPEQTVTRKKPAK